MGPGGSDFLYPLRCVLWCVMPAMTLTLHAAIAPDEVVVVFNKREHGSEDIARHYAERRGVPTKQVVGFYMPINETITRELNELLGLELTDAFCGFKAYRRDVLPRFQLTETGWGMPLQLWVQAAALGLRIKEVGVPRIYLDPDRAFGGVLNDAEQRLAYYRGVIRDTLASLPCAEPSGWDCLGMAPHSWSRR